MRILLTNDDGFLAEGLEVLERVARTLSDDIWIVAPETDQSGFAHSLSLSEPLRMRQLDERRYALRGTPTDCVIMGVRRLMSEPPDLILSGINSGSNIADDVTYSGTIAGAMEGTLLGIRSIALSQAYTVSEEGRSVRWDTAEKVGSELIGRLVGLDLPAGVFLNVNFPAVAPEEVQGTRVAAQGKRIHGLWIEERKDGRGLPYYWLRFGREAPEVRAGTDMAALRDGYVSVTPLHLDLTANEVMDPIRKALA